MESRMTVIVIHPFSVTRAAMVASVMMLGAPVWTGAAQAQTLAEQGQEVFNTICVACHTVGGGRLIGPDLQGVSERRDEAWILEFVKHSQAVINSGDAQATALAAEYPGLVMPDNAFTDDQIRAIIAYTDSDIAAAPVQTTLQVATPAMIDLGQNLFQGIARFENGGPTCNSCHDVTNDAVIGGGVLAIELTTVFTRLGGLGVRAILGSPPFPVMQRAYQDKPLTDAEVAALVGFLEEADAQKAFHQPRDYGPKLFVAGVFGAAILLGLYSLLWRGRKRGSVNQAIYDRQVRST
jgi:mono/diheme cytochrome c family protein